MMFRKLYWVTEQLQAGTARVTGVYTSVPDLIRKGLIWHGETAGDTRMRLTLVKLDSSKGPLGEWENSTFASLVTDLEPFVRTDEFRLDEVLDLVSAINAFLSAPVG